MHLANDHGISRLRGRVTTKTGQKPSRQKATHPAGGPEQAARANRLIVVPMGDLGNVPGEC
jgi:hypothetical protein